MSIPDQINVYIASLPEQKHSDLQALHDFILKIAPKARLWFLDGRNDAGKVVSNPNIGYGFQRIPQANQKFKEFYQVGLSANTTGISVYIMGLADKHYLSDTFGDTIGKASVTGYCIKFKSLADVKFDVLQAAIRFGLAPK